MAGHFHMDEDGVSISEMNEYILCSASCAGNFRSDDLFFEMGKIFRIFYIILARMKSAFVICPHITNTEPDGMFEDAIYCCLYFGKLGHIGSLSGKRRKYKLLDSGSYLSNLYSRKQQNERSSFP